MHAKNYNKNNDQNEKKIILITRTWNKKEIKEFIEKIHTKLYKIIVLVNSEKESDYYTQTLLSRCNNACYDKLEIIHVKPWGVASGAFNIGLTRAFNCKPDYILIASPEVRLKEDHVKKMSDILTGEPNMLVIGYALKANLKKLTNIERGHSFKKNTSDALRVPWNTCAMWKADLFLKYVGTFHIICDCSKYLGKDRKIELRGMEDALAIALAQKKDSTIKIGLIKDHLEWIVKKEKITEHKKKMIRKRLVYQKYKQIFKLPKKITINLLT